MTPVGETRDALAANELHLSRGDSGREPETLTLVFPYHGGRITTG